MTKARIRPPKPVEAIVHRNEKRLNIPTRELRGFVLDEERSPGKMLYARDTSLDPQLVWKGKDEQDSRSLVVPVLPIYIQEKISPQALIEDLRLTAQKGKPRQFTLFDDFNGLEFEKVVDFYHHEQNWTNRMILGDSLLVMTSLSEKEGLKGKVQTIYIDPPYGIKFASNWQVSTKNRSVADGKVEDATRQPEQVKAYRDTWELGIHSYLSYLRDRLVAARELLTTSGSVFVQISDENSHLVRSLLDEVFGSENFIATISFVRAGAQTSEIIASTSDFLHWYAKDKEQVKTRRLFLRSGGWAARAQDQWIELADGTRRRIRESEEETVEGRRFTHRKLESATGGPSSRFPIQFGGKSILPTRGWSTHPEGVEKLKIADRLLLLGDSLRFIVYHDDFPLAPLSNAWTDTFVSGFANKKIYVVETPTRVIERCVLLTTDPGDLVLDPTCGSGTTAFSAELWGRRWITIDTSRVAISLARTRLMAAKFPYFLLADSTEGIAKQALLLGHPTGAGKPANDVRKGFVYERATRITLESIANNPELKPGMKREEVRSAIERHSETEVLYDRPFSDPDRIRVSGPFTVESLSPHRTLGTSLEGEEAKAGREDSGPGRPDFVEIILENLRRAGVQNMVKKERLVFSHLDSYPGTYINAEGEYDENGKSRRVAVCVGPEHGTVGPDLVKEAAKEAVEGRGFDLLIVCGFAFDPYADEESKHYGRLTVQIARMNPDLAMGDELLKKTGTGNLFTVFGEPDLDVRKSGNQYLVEVRGVDVYDPTTGVVRSHSTDDIACWFIDTDYNGESFFVRHAYFCGGDEPYEKLQRALRADVDESAWKAIYSTTSRAFDRPKTGKIAVKVINYYGDEVLKVRKI